MKKLFNRSLIILGCAVCLLGCQNQQTAQSPDAIEEAAPKKAENAAITDKPMNNEQASKPKYLKPSCKNYSSPPIKDKSKIREMLLKEGKINAEMSEEEINNFVEQFIRNKTSQSCTPSKIKAGITPLVEKNVYV